MPVHGVKYLPFLIIIDNLINNNDSIISVHYLINKEPNWKDRFCAYRLFLSLNDISGGGDYIQNINSW